ncbi:MAG: hypothetical protein JSS83_13255 [Cyanobacteria bacterium SZAS LIN-3]|nr:hypothetical protein [Cyanobacteria bacterium SZAS LIN-3]MBS2005508.1 hypothetical protein [Cyanobacteria bacterium SZAS TMP-1]
MSRATENFDIADLKRSSVRMKGALQVEWQEEIKAMAPAAAGNLDLASLDFNDDETRSFLPRIDLTLKLNGNFKNVSYVPSLSNLQGQGNSQAFSPLAISQMTC